MRLLWALPQGLPGQSFWGSHACLLDLLGGRTVWCGEQPQFSTENMAHPRAEQVQFVLGEVLLHWMDAVQVSLGSPSRPPPTGGSLGHLTGLRHPDCSRVGTGPRLRLLVQCRSSAETLGMGWSLPATISKLRSCNFVVVGKIN